MENPDLQSDSALDMIAAISTQNSIAKRILPCLTPLGICTALVIPMSDLIVANEL